MTRSGLRNMFTAAGVACVVAVAVTACGGRSSAATIEVPNAKATLSLVVKDRHVNAGETFTVDVMVDTDTGIRAEQGALIFDPALVRYEDVAEGDFLKDWASANGAITLVFPEPVADNERGRVSDIGVSIMGGRMGGPKGTGLAWRYTFTALKDGTVSLQLDDALLTVPSKKDPRQMLDLIPNVVN